MTLVKLANSIALCFNENTFNKQIPMKLVTLDTYISVGGNILLALLATYCKLAKVDVMLFIFSFLLDFTNDAMSYLSK